MSVTGFWTVPTVTVGVNAWPAPGVQVIRAVPLTFEGPKRPAQFVPLLVVMVEAIVPLNIFTVDLSESVQPPRAPLTVIVFVPVEGLLFLSAVANVMVPESVLQVT